MQNIYKNLEVLDKRAIDKYRLSEDILMENAAASMHQLIARLTHKGSMVIIVCGGGNNGGDGYALARRLTRDYNVKVMILKEPKTKMCQIQYQRAMEAQVEVIKKFLPCDVMVDCLFGSGFVGGLLPDMQKVIMSMNQTGRIKIACDIPSGIDKDGNIADLAFKADYTISMGALKTALFSDIAKDFVGEIVVGDLGVSRQMYEISSNIKLLEKSDMTLPYRNISNVHKGNFGHLCVYIGKQSGAGILAALAGLNFGAGLVSLVGKEVSKPIELMYSEKIPENTTAFALGMGSGEAPQMIAEMLSKAPCVLDADLFYWDGIKEVLNNNQKIVLTPHPKEFVSLLHLSGFLEISLEEFLKNKLEILAQFASQYPQAVIVLKGANTLIAQNEKIYINTFGKPNLAKGGSGDVLAGLIGALLAQGYEPLNAAISASLAHSFGSRMEKSTYALTPTKLIEYIRNLD